MFDFARNCSLLILGLLLSGCATRLATSETGVGARALGEAELGETIDLADFGSERLASAIFHESNRVRAAEGLRPFRAWDKLDHAADTQAALGVVFRPPSHTNPFFNAATPVDRVKLAGVQPERVAENIALLPLADAPSGVVGLMRTDGRLKLVDGNSGEPVRDHTYASFAAAVVRGWMNSPGHRAHLLDPELEYLGCSARPTRSLTDVPMVFAVQVFCTPARVKRRG